MATPYIKVPLDLARMAWQEGWINPLLKWVNLKRNHRGGVAPGAEVRGMFTSRQIKAGHLSKLIEKGLLREDKRGNFWIASTRETIAKHKLKSRAIRIFDDLPLKDFKTFFVAAFYILCSRWSRAVHAKSRAHLLLGEQSGTVSVRMLGRYLGISHTHAWNFRRKAHSAGLIVEEKQFESLGYLSAWEFINHPLKNHIFAIGAEFFKRKTSKIFSTDSPIEYGCIY